MKMKTVAYTSPHEEEAKKVREVLERMNQVKGGNKWYYYYFCRETNLFTIISEGEVTITEEEKQRLQELRTSEKPMKDGDTDLQRKGFVLVLQGVTFPKEVIQGSTN